MINLERSEAKSIIEVNEYIKKKNAAPQVFNKRHIHISPNMLKVEALHDYIGMFPEYKYTELEAYTHEVIMYLAAMYENDPQKEHLRKYIRYKLELEMDI